MAKGKITKYHPRPIDISKPQENFAEYYSFDKKNRVGPREGMVGISKWDKKYGGGSEYMKECCPQEYNYTRGGPSKFRQTKPAGKLRVSGAAGAHRIGKR